MLGWSVACGYEYWREKRIGIVDTKDTTKGGNLTQILVVLSILLNTC